MHGRDTRKTEKWLVSYYSRDEVAGSNLYCWHVFWGRPGTNNDLSFVEFSPLVQGILTGKLQMKLSEGYTIDGRNRDWHLYYLTDGIYPEYSIFVKSHQAPVTAKEKKMTKYRKKFAKTLEFCFEFFKGNFVY